MLYGSTTDPVAAAYAAHQAELQRFAEMRVRDPEAAEDIVQNAYLRLSMERAAGRFPENPRAWLYRVAGNEIIDRGRRATVAARFVATETAESVDEESPERRYLAMEGQRRLVLALRAASPRGRHGLSLAAEGYSGREIATAIGTSEVAARALMHRARRAAQRQLRDEVLPVCA